MALTSISTSSTSPLPFSIFTLKELLAKHFSKVCVKDLCAKAKISQEEGHERIILLVLDIFGDASQAIQFTLSKMDNPTFKEIFNARILRHLDYIEGWQGEQSLEEIIKKPAVNCWLQKLSSADFTRPPMARLSEERLQTYRLISDPQEALLWKGGGDLAADLNRKRIQQRKQLYTFINERSFPLNETIERHLGSLIYKDIALYAAARPITWIEALHDWSHLCENKERVLVLLQLLPPEIFQQKNSDFFLPKEILSESTRFFKFHPTFSFQEFIALATLYVLEQSLELPSPSLDREAWIAKCTRSENLRSQLVFYSCRKKIVLQGVSPLENDFSREEGDILSFYFLDSLLAEGQPALKPTEKKEEKHDFKINKIPAVSPSSELADFRVYLLKIILARHKKWDKKIFPYFSSFSQEPPAESQKKQLLARERLSSLKAKKAVSYEYEFIFFMNIYREEEVFAEIEKWLLCPIGTLTVLEKCDIALILMQLKKPTEMVDLLLMLVKSPLLCLTKKQILQLCRQSESFPPDLIGDLFSRLMSQLNPNQFLPHRGELFHLLVTPGYYLNQNEKDTFLQQFLIQFAFYKKARIDATLFFTAYRLFLEGKINTKYLDYLYYYEECTQKALRSSTWLRVLSGELPPIPELESQRKSLQSYVTYLSSDYCSPLYEEEKIILWLSWASTNKPPSHFAHVNTFISRFAQYLGFSLNSDDLYLLLKTLPYCKKGARQLEQLSFLRHEMLKMGEQCVLCPQLLTQWEEALNKCAVLPPTGEDETPLVFFNTQLKNYCHKATFFSTQLLTNCFYIETTTENNITYPKSEKFFNHGGQLKEILPSLFVAVNWEPYTKHSPLMLALFFLNVRSRQKRWLFFPLKISPTTDASTQKSMFTHLRELAEIFLAETGAKEGLSKESNITMEDVLGCYPQAVTHLVELNKMGLLKILLGFLTRLKIETRNAWWNIQSVSSEKERTSFPEKERKMQLPPPLHSPKKLVTSTTQLSQSVMTQAKTAILQEKRNTLLTKIYLEKIGEVILFLNSTRNRKIIGNYWVMLFCTFNKRQVVLSPLDYPRSFLEDEIAFNLLFSAHFQGLKEKCRQT